MTRNSTTEVQANPLDWRVEQLRMTAYPATVAPLALVRDWWNMVTETVPTRVLENPPGGSVQLFGDYKGAPLLMTGTSGQLDIVRPFHLPQMHPDTLPSLPDALAPFVDLEARWFKLAARPSVKRLALGVIALKTFTEIEACRDALDDLLPAIDMQMAETRDFLYGSNRRRPSQVVSGLAVNRIAKWSINLFRDVSTGDPVYAARLEMDLNSDAEHDVDLDRPTILFGELVDCATQLAREGDQP